MDNNRDIVDPLPGKLPIAPGETVYDASGDKIGTVRQYDPQADCLVVEEKGILSAKDVYIPGSAVQSSDANGVRVTLTKNELKEHRYGSPPTC